MPAEDSFRAALRHDPRSAFAHQNWRKFLGGKLPEGDLAALRGLLAEGSASAEKGICPTGQGSAAFRPGVCPGRLGEYAEAAEHLSGERFADVRVAKSRPRV